MFSPMLFQDVGSINPIENQISFLCYFIQISPIPSLSLISSNYQLITLRKFFPVFSEIRELHVATIDWLLCVQLQTIYVICMSIAVDSASPSSLREGKKTDIHIFLKLVLYFYLLKFLVFFLAKFCAKLSNLFYYADLFYFPPAFINTVARKINVIHSLN